MMTFEELIGRITGKILYDHTYYLGWKSLNELKFGLLRTIAKFELKSKDIKSFKEYKDLLVKENIVLELTTYLVLSIRRINRKCIFPSDNDLLEFEKEDVRRNELNITKEIMMDLFETETLEDLGNVTDDDLINYFSMILLYINRIILLKNSNSDIEYQIVKFINSCKKYDCGSLGSVWCELNKK